jgi:hypothetical protein
MAKKRVINKELAEKSKQIKGSVRSEVALAAMAARSTVQKDKKRHMKSSTRNEKHKARYF